MTHEPVRIVFGPTGRDPVQIILPDGTDVAPQMRIVAISAKVDGFGSESEATIRIAGPKIELLTRLVDQDDRASEAHE